MTSIAISPAFVSKTESIETAFSIILVVLHRLFSELSIYRIYENKFPSIHQSIQLLRIETESDCLNYMSAEQAPHLEYLFRCIVISNAMLWICEVVLWAFYCPAGMALSRLSNWKMQKN